MVLKALRLNRSRLTRDKRGTPIGKYKSVQIAYSPAIFASLSPRNIIGIVVLGAIMAWFWRA